VRVPVVVGVNVTVSVQLAPDASVLEQLLVCAKSPVAAPMESVVLAVPVFFTATVWLGLVVPTVCEEKVKLDGVNVIVTIVPVPVRLTVCGEFEAWSVIKIEPVRVPDAVGVNVTVSVQLAPGPSDAPQLFVCAKSPVAAPMESVVDTVPVFLTDTVWLILVVPTS